MESNPKTVDAFGQYEGKDQPVAVDEESVADVSCLESQIDEVSWCGRPICIGLKRAVGSGDCRSTLVCIHGALCDSSSFDFVLKSPPIGVEVLAIDLPGHGSSSHMLAEQRPDSFPVALESMAEVVVSLLQQRDVQDYGMMCHSLGGAVGLIAAAKMRIPPRYFISLEGNLVSSCCGQKGTAHWLGAESQSRADILADLEVRSTNEAFPDYWPGCAARIPTLPEFGHYLFSSLVEWSDSGKLPGILGRLNHTHYVHGPKTGKYSGLMKEALGAIHVKVHEVPDAGHFMFFDDPARTRQIIEEAIEAAGSNRT